MERKLYRSKTDRMLAGVAGGLAEYVGQDPTLIRIGLVLLTLVTSGSVVLAYLVLWIVVPEAPAEPGGEPGKTLADEWFGPKDGSRDGATGPTPAPEAPTPPEPVTPASPAPETPASPGPAAPLVGVGPPASSLTGSGAPAAPAPAASTGSGGGWWFGVALVAFGVFMLAERFLPRLDLWDLWPAAIIIIGLVMVFSRKDG